MLRDFVGYFLLNRICYPHPHPQACGKIVADSCASLYFVDDQIKFGLIRAIVQSKKTPFVFLSKNLWKLNLEHQQLILI